MPTIQEIKDQIKNRFNIAKGVAGFGASVPALPAAVASDISANVPAMVKKAGYGVAGLLTGLEPPKTPPLQMKGTSEVWNMAGSSVNDVVQGVKSMWDKTRQDLIKAGFKEPAAPSASPAVPPVSPAQTPKVTVPKSPAPTSAALPSVETPTKKVAAGVENISPGKLIGGVEVSGNAFKSINPSLPTTSVDTPSQMVDNIEGSGGKVPYWATKSESYANNNPNDTKFLEMVNDLISTASTGAPSVARHAKLNALRTAIGALGPMTSYGNFGVAKMNNEIAQGRLGVEQGNLALGRKKAETEALEATTKGELYKANALEAMARARTLSNASKPEAFDTQAQKSWLSGWDSYLKNDMVLADIMDKPEGPERDAAIATHQSLYRQLNPPVPIRKVANPDGTITVTFADGSTQKMKKKGAQ